jgi:hypothetical protein
LQLGWHSPAVVLRFRVFPSESTVRVQILPHALDFDVILNVKGVDVSRQRLGE